MSKNLLTDEELKNLILDYKNNGNMLARDEIMEKNLGLVSSIVKKHPNDSILSFDDLFQEGSLGLLKAIEKFDVEKGYRFSTYATWWIKQSIRRALSDNNRSIRIPIHVQERISRIKNAKKSLEQELNRDPEIDEIIEKLNVDFSFYDKIVNHEYFQTLADICYESTDDSDIQDILLILNESFDFNSDVEIILKELVLYMKKNKMIPNPETIKRKLNISKKKLLEYLNFDTNISSLDLTIGEDMESSVGDNIASSENIEENYNQKVFYEGLNRAITECYENETEKTKELIKSLNDGLKFFEEFKNETLKVNYDFIVNLTNYYPNMKENSIKELEKYLFNKTKLKKNPTDTIDLNINEAIKDLHNQIEKKSRPKINKAILLKKRFGICGYNKCTLEELGNYFNVSRERVRQIEKKILHDENFKSKILEYCNISMEDFN